MTSGSNLLWEPRFLVHIVMRGSEDRGNGCYVDGLKPLEAIRVVSRLERLNRRQVVEEAENRRVLHQEGNQYWVVSEQWQK